MERGHYRGQDKGRRRRCLILSLVAILLVVIVVAVLLAALLRQDGFKRTFIERCQKFKGHDCEKIWTAFQQAYVGKDPCKVPMEAYDNFIAAAPLKPECNRMMFWSKTKDVVHNFTEKRDCFLTMEDTLVGFVADGLTWCGREGSSETLTTGCPGWTDCENNTVRSFWSRASAAFADAACGAVTVMLNGSIASPFSPSSVFGSIEVKRLNSTRVKSLKVALVTQQDFVTNCTNASLKDLQKELDQGIQYNCKEVPEAQILECSADKEKPCGSCL